MALFSIESVDNSASGDVLVFQNSIRKLYQLGISVALQCGITGNGRAEELIKKETSTQINSNPVPFPTLQRIIRRRVFINLHIQLMERTIYKKWKDIRRNSIPDWPRRETMAQFPLFIGHDYLATHLPRIVLTSEPLCSICGV